MSQHIEGDYVTYEDYAQLVAALERAKETVYAFHGEIAWEEYQHSPEMREINAALTCARRPVCTIGRWTDDEPEAKP